VACYLRFVDKKAYNIPTSISDQPPSFEDLALQQGVAPVEDIEVLFGKPSPEDESADEFAARLREWRREGDGTSPQ
jgi:hypothetical protein